MTGKTESDRELHRLGVLRASAQVLSLDQSKWQLRLSPGLSDGLPPPPDGYAPQGLSGARGINYNPGYEGVEFGSQRSKPRGS